MGNETSKLTTPFSDCTIEPRVETSWWPGRRWWKDSPPSSTGARARDLILCPKNFPLSLVIQESTIMKLSRVYRLVLAPKQGGDKVIVLAPKIVQYQEALSMMMTIHVQPFQLGPTPHLCFSDGRATVGTNSIHPVGSWPPAQDRVTLDARFDGNTSESGVVFCLSEKGNEAEMEADIILWHGLGGHPEDTWKIFPDDQDKKTWPIWRLLDVGNKEHNLYAAETRLGFSSLPQPHKIRVISINHKLCIFESGNALADQDVDSTVRRIWESLDRAQVGLRPAVWLCHSLGCLLAKEVLKRDYEKGSRGLQLCNSVRGVLFYGGPHNGSELAGAIRQSSLALRTPYVTLKCNIAPAAVNYLSHANLEGHQAVNDFFFRQTIPFINFRETRPAMVTISKPINLSAEGAIIVADNESDVAKHMEKAGRALIQDELVPFDYMAHPETLCAQRKVNQSHLDIASPRWQNGQPPETYTLSREAIAIWLRWRSPQGSSINTNVEWTGELAQEISALVAAMSIASGGPFTPEVLYSCAWSNASFETLRDDYVRNRPPLNNRERAMTQEGNRRAAAMSDLGTTLANSSPLQPVHPMVVLQIMVTILGVGIVTSVGAIAFIGLMPVIAATLVVLLGLSSSEARSALATTYQTISVNTLTLAHQRKDLIMLSGTLGLHLTDTFNRIDKFRSMSPRSKLILKHHWLRRYRDILFALLLLPANPDDVATGEIDLLDYARTKLDHPTQDVDIPNLIKRLQSIRAEKLKAQLDRLGRNRSARR